MYKYFIGCASIEEVKKRYRKLAFEHHPDKGGNAATFVELTAEYTKITGDGYVSFPIRDVYKETKAYSYSNNTGFNEFEEAIRFAERQRQQRRAQAEQAAREDTRREQQRRQHEYAKQQAKEWEEFFNNFDYKNFNRSVNCELIDTLVTEAIAMKKSLNWLLMELFKIEDLVLDDFKYLRDALYKRDQQGKRCTDDWVRTVYQNYISVKDIGMTFE